MKIAKHYENMPIIDGKIQIKELIVLKSIVASNWKKVKRYNFLSTSANA